MADESASDITRAILMKRRDEMLAEAERLKQMLEGLNLAINVLNQERNRGG